MKITFNLQLNRIEIRFNGSNFADVLMDVKRLPYREYDKESKVWHCPLHTDVEVPLFLLAAKYKSTVDEMTKAAFESIRDRKKTNLLLSAAKKIPSSHKHVKFRRENIKKAFDFQRAGVLYMVLNRHVLLADDMGLGKTMQSLLAVAECEGWPLLVICPASLKYNWQNEVNKWTPGQRVVIAGGDGDEMSGATVVIINYDILHKYPFLSAIPWRSVIVDESHYCKNYQSRRSQLVKEICEGKQNVFLLSGTPITNKPYDVLQQLVILERVTDFGGFWAFAKYYCNAQEVWRGNKKGWDFSGALHLEELNTKLREMCYIRREKTEVLKDLPEKTRDYLPVDIINRPEYERAVLDIVEYVRSKKGDEKARAAARAQALVKISVCRQIAAAGKRWAVVSWVKNFLETTNEKIVLFGWHKDAILDLMGDLAEYINDANLAYYQVAITGETDAEERNEVVRLFQEDPECRILIANIQAGGVGLTLTAASKILFFEFGWTPAEMAQAEDRIYRIGQKNNCVIYYMFARQTIDEHFIKMLADKKAVVDQATDGNFEYIYDLIEKESLKYGTRTNEFEPEWPASYGEYDSAHDYRTLESSDSESQGVEQEEDIPDL